MEAPVNTGGAADRRKYRGKRAARRTAAAQSAVKPMQASPKAPETAKQELPAAEGQKPVTQPVEPAQTDKAKRQPAQPIAREPVEQHSTVATPPEPPAQPEKPKRQPAQPIPRQPVQRPALEKTSAQTPAPTASGETTMAPPAVMTPVAPPAPETQQTENKAAAPGKQSAKDKRSRHEKIPPAKMYAESREQKRKQPAAEPQAVQNAEPAAGKPTDNANELPVEDEKRLADLTRTVQLSVEQVMKGLEANGVLDNNDLPEAAPGTPATEAAEQPYSTADEEEAPKSFGRRVLSALGSGVLRTLKWLALVVFFVALIGFAGVFWVYQSVSRESLPNIHVTFDGQELQQTAHDWEVPVIGNEFKRTFDETVGETPYVLPDPVESANPVLTVSPDEYSSEITLYDADKKEIFSGNLSQFKSYNLPGNGEYSAKLVLRNGTAVIGATAAVTGSQTYDFDFKVDVRASIRLSTQSITQGSILAIRVTGLLGDEPPKLESIYADTGFVKTTSGWVCYLPIPYDAKVGTSELSVTAGGYTDTVPLAIRARNWDSKDYGSYSSFTSPFIGVDEAPDKVKAVLGVVDPQIYWTDKGFVQPFLSSVTVNLAFGVTEYAGRTATQRAYGTGEGRTALNCLITTVAGDPLIAPCGGLVLLAEDLGGTAGNTVVIEHGAGLKSIFYCLRDIMVEEGDYVVQGQTIGRTNRKIIAEMRIGSVPVEPFSIWRGQCDAIKIY